MAELSATKLLAPIVVLTLTQVGHAGQGGYALKINPFVRPLETHASRTQPAASEKESAVPFVLRGTMVAGKRSLANISGVIVSLGKDINGYTLAVVHQREVVLVKGDERRILSVDGEDEGK
jgi:hypothetical protein